MCKSTFIAIFYLMSIPTSILSHQQQSTNTSASGGAWKYRESIPC